MRQVLHPAMGAGLFAQPFSSSLRPPSFGTELSDVDLQLAALRDRSKNNRLLSLLQNTAKRLSRRWQSNSNEESTMSLPGDIMQRGVFSSVRNKAQRVNG